MPKVVGSFAEVLLRGKNCIVVKRGGSSHVRRYRRDVKGGMSFLMANFHSMYDALPYLSYGLDTKLFNEVSSDVE